MKQNDNQNESSSCSKKLNNHVIELESQLMQGKLETHIFHSRRCR